MANRFLVSLLVIIVIASVAFNYIQYENTQYLQQTISEYKKQIDSATETKTIPPTPVLNPANQSSGKTTAYNVTDTSLKSISAVAVRPILASDGFFETTTYAGTVLKITVEIREIGRASCRERV